MNEWPIKPNNPQNDIVLWIVLFCIILFVWTLGMIVLVVVTFTGW